MAHRIGLLVGLAGVMVGCWSDPAHKTPTTAVEETVSATAPGHGSIIQELALRAWAHDGTPSAHERPLFAFQDLALVALPTVTIIEDGVEWRIIPLLARNPSTRPYQFRGWDLPGIEADFLWWEAETVELAESGSARGAALFATPIAEDVSQDPFAGAQLTAADRARILVALADDPTVAGQYGLTLLRENETAYGFTVPLRIREQQRWHAADEWSYVAVTMEWLGVRTNLPAEHLHIPDALVNLFPGAERSTIPMAPRKMITVWALIPPANERSHGP